MTRTYTQDEHAIINRDATPDNAGTRMVCDLCREFSGSCEDDAFIFEHPITQALFHLCDECVRGIMMEAS